MCLLPKKTLIIKKKFIPQIKVDKVEDKKIEKTEVVEQPKRQTKKSKPVTENEENKPS